MTLNVTFHCSKTPVLSYVVIKKVAFVSDLSWRPMTVAEPPPPPPAAAPVAPEPAEEPTPPPPPPPPPQQQEVKISTYIQPCIHAFSKRFDHLVHR